jgi:C4-dicarboxylate-specific signal transduction histidine kinase
VTVKFVTEGRSGLVVINRPQFQQVLLNLFQNALEALGQSAEQRRVLLVCCSCRDDLEVIIRVEDNGPGIAPADRGRIFDAFFTTRPGGLGMGLVSALDDQGTWRQARGRTAVTVRDGTHHPSPGDTCVRARPGQGVGLVSFFLTQSDWF